MEIKQGLSSTMSLKSIWQKIHILFDHRYPIFISNLLLKIYYYSKIMLQYLQLLSQLVKKQLNSNDQAKHENAIQETKIKNEKY